MTDFHSVLAMLHSPIPRIRLFGSVVEIATDRIRVSGLSQYVNMADLLTVATDHQHQVFEVCHIGDECVSAIPYDLVNRAKIGNRVERRGALSVSPTASWKGRVVNALGMPIDNLAILPTSTMESALQRAPPRPMERALLDTPFVTGVAAVDAFTPLCVGQRIGVMAGSGVGKSTLLAMLAQAPTASTIVLALIGERGREVREFLESTLGHARERVIAVVATAEESTMMRRLAAKTAMAISERLRDDGENVFLIIDSLTRFAHAQRDFALAADEPPVARGYPPSVFREMSVLLERAGAGKLGSITLVASVLIDGDDHNDPVADAVRGIVDGHLVLDRNIAAEGRWPAMNLLQSVSRLAERVWSPSQKTLITELRQAMARYEETRELRAIGEYRSGRSAELDRAVAVVPLVYAALRQGPRDISVDPFAILAKAVEASSSMTEPRHAGRH